MEQTNPVNNKTTYLSSQVFLDNNYRIIDFNTAATEQFNLYPKNIGSSFSHLSHYFKDENLLRYIKWAIKTQQSKKQLVETANGKWYTMTISPCSDISERPSAISSVSFEEVTNAESSMRMLALENNKLAKINKDHRLFIYSVSHDLRGPLNNLDGLLALLARLENDEEREAILNYLGQEVEKLKAIINGLADLKLIEKETDKPVNVNLLEILEEVKWSLKDQFSQFKTKLHIELETTKIKFCKKNLRCILLNLLSNAIKFKAVDRELVVEIKSQKIKDYVLLSIRDNGIGISKNDIPKLFKKYSRLRNAGHDTDGSGMGLYLVKKIMTNGEGKIEVESERGRGSCFNVFFKA